MSSKANPTEARDQLSSDLPSVAAELNNLAVYFHESNNLGIAAAMYPDAIQALEQHTNHCETKANDKETCRSLKMWRNTVMERRNMLRVYGSIEDPLGSQMLNAIHGYTTNEHMLPIRPLEIETKTLDKSTPLFAIFLFNLGLVDFQLGQKSKAAERLELAAAFISSSDQNDGLCVKTFLFIHCVLGLLYAQQRKFHDAVNELNAALRTRADLVPEECYETCAIMIDTLKCTLLSMCNENVEHTVIHGTVVESLNRTPIFPWDERSASPAA